MKRLLSLLVSIALTLSLAACGETESTDFDFGKTTLMVFALGEQPGALAEMEQAGLDLSKVSLVVCETAAIPVTEETTDGEDAQTDAAEEDAPVPVTLARTHRHLTENGFVTDSEASIDAADNEKALADFLSNAKAQHPADHYGLFVIADGHGPLGGVGDKAAFAQNGLSLADIQHALAASPFAAEKLDFIGFDAGMMGSVETASVLSPFAHYLLASEEVMPSIGLDYTALTQTSRCDSLSLLTLLAEGFNNAYSTHCRNRGGDNIAGVMTVTDLEKIPAVTDALNALFKAIDPAAHYDAVAAARMNSYVCGLTTAALFRGDTVDAVGFTDNLAPLAREEAAALCAALSEATVCHSSYIPHANGLSLYYPFGGMDECADRLTAYADFDALTDYAAHLSTFAATLTGDATLPAATVTAPVVSDTAVTLDITAEQAERLADARLVVFRKEQNRYFPVYHTGAKLTVDGNTLTADFDKNALYVRDDYGNVVVSSFVYAEQTVGDITYYAVRFHATYTDEDDPRSPLCAITVRVDNQTGEVLWGDKLLVGEDRTAADKQPSLSDGGFEMTTFDTARPLFPTFDDSGAQNPIRQWTTDSPDGSYVSFAIWYAERADLSFEMLPLETAEYYTAFELTDSHNVVYYSDMTPITIEGELPAFMPEAEPIDVTWDSGDTVKLLEQDNVTVSLLKERDFQGDGYRFVIRNDNDFEVTLSADSVIVNDVYFARYGGRSSLYAVPPHATIVDNEFFDFGNLSTFIDLNGMTSLQFNLTVEESSGALSLAASCPIVLDQPIRITLNKETALSDVDSLLSYRDYTVASKGLHAEEQPLFDEDGITLTLMQFGNSSDYGSPSALWRAENTTDQPLSVDILGGVFGDVFVSASSNEIAVPAGLTGFASYSSFNRDTLDAFDSADRLSLVFSYRLGDGKAKVITCPVTLKQKGEPPVLKEGETVLGEEHGIRLTLVSYELDDNYGNPKHKWTVVVTNHSGKDVSLDYAPLSDKSVSFLYGRVGDGQKTQIVLSCYAERLDEGETPSIHLAAKDLTEQETLFTFETPIVLPMA